VNDINEPVAPQGQANGAAVAETGADGALAAALAKADENWNTYLRLAAEFENFRKRADRELDNARKYAVERFAQELLPVADALEMGLSAAAGAAGNALQEGMEATRGLLHKAFEKGGIRLIDPVAQPFDPAWHEAMVVQESAQAAPDTVLNVVQKGYSLNGRLLRPARVIVSKAPGGN